MWQSLWGGASSEPDTNASNDNVGQQQPSTTATTSTSIAVHDDDGSDKYIVGGVPTDGTEDYISHDDVDGVRLFHSPQQQQYYQSPYSMMTTPAAAATTTTAITTPNHHQSYYSTPTNYAGTPPNSAATASASFHRLIHWKDVHHETCVRQTTLAATLKQVVEDDHATIDVLPQRCDSDVLLWNNTEETQKQVLTRFEKIMVAVQSSSTPTITPSKKSQSTITSATTKTTTPSAPATTTASTSIFSSPSAKMLGRAVISTASLVTTPISFALRAAASGPVSDYDEPAPNVEEFYENENDDEETESDPNNVNKNNKDSATKTSTSTSNNKSDTTTSSTNNDFCFLSQSVGMNEVLVDVNLTLACLRLIYKAIADSEDRILTLPATKKTASSSEQTPSHDWPRWIFDIASEYANDDDDDIAAVLSDLSMEQTHFLLAVLQDYQALQVVRRQPNQVDLIVLPEAAATEISTDEMSTPLMQTRIAKFDIDCQLQRLQTLMDLSSARIDKYTRQAVRLKKAGGKQQQALYCLRQKRLVEQQLDTYQQQFINLERIQLAVEQSAGTQTTHDALRQATQAFQTLRQESSLSSMEAIDDVLDDLEEEMDHQTKMQATTSSSHLVGGEPVDEDDLMKELEQLDGDDAAAAVIVSSSSDGSNGGGGDAKQATLKFPSPPKSNVTSDKKTTTTSTSDPKQNDIADMFQKQLQLN